MSKLIVLDPHKRLSVREALQHPWVLGKAARFSHMDTTQRKLQEFNARRKLKVRIFQVQEKAIGQPRGLVLLYGSGCRSNR